MSGETNYGATLTKGGNSIGDCIVIDFTELKTNKVQVTSHNSNGKREWIPDGLIGLEDITLSVIVASGILPAMYAEMEAGTKSECVITDNVDSMTFDGFYTSLKKEAADAQNPDVIKVTVVLSPTGDIDIVSL